MNERQKVCLFVGVMVASAMMLWPPWIGASPGCSYGYVFVLDASSDAKLNLTRLIVQLIPVVVLTGLSSLLTAGTKKPVA